MKLLWPPRAERGATVLPYRSPATVLKTLLIFVPIVLITLEA